YRLGHLKHVQGGAQKQSVRRLEPERRAQNHGLCLFAPRARRTDRLYSCPLERSGKLPEKEKRRAFEIPLRSGRRPRRKIWGPFRDGRKTQTKAADETEDMMYSLQQGL